MSKEKSITKSEKYAKSLSDWDLAIMDARESIKRLKSSIRLWEEMRDKGEKWPGFEVSQPQQESPHEGG